MPYATESDLRARLGGDLLILLADEDGDGAADEVVLDAALADAAARIDAALAGRGAPPPDPVPPLLIRICVDLAVEGLFARRREAISPELAARGRDARELLEEIARGVAPLPLAAMAAPESTTRGTARHFDRAALETY